MVPQTDRAYSCFSSKTTLQRRVCPAYRTSLSSIPLSVRTFPAPPSIVSVRLQFRPLVLLFPIMPHQRTDCIVLSICVCFFSQLVFELLEDKERVPISLARSRMSDKREFHLNFCTRFSFPWVSQLSSVVGQKELNTRGCLDHEPSETELALLLLELLPMSASQRGNVEQMNKSESWNLLKDTN